MFKRYIGKIGIYAESDRFIEEILINEEYKFLFNYDTVVDLGCNIGTFSLWIYPHAKKIYSVEPNPKAMKLLEQTVRDNDLDKITLCEYAITGIDGKRYLKNSDDEHKDYGSGTVNAKEGILVKGVAIDTFMVKHNIEYIDLLKVDVEGAEQEIFESDAFKSVASKIGTIIGEYHTGDIFMRIGRALSHCGFKFTDLQTRFIARRI